MPGPARGDARAPRPRPAPDRAAAPRRRSPPRRRRRAAGRASPATSDVGRPLSSAPPRRTADDAEDYRDGKGPSGESRVREEVRRMTSARTRPRGARRPSTHATQRRASLLRRRRIERRRRSVSVADGIAVSGPPVREPSRAPRSPAATPGHSGSRLRSLRTRSGSGEPAPRLRRDHQVRAPLAPSATGSRSWKPERSASEITRAATPTARPRTEIVEISATWARRRDAAR